MHGVHERNKTLYEVLGVGPTASAAEIRTAYRELATRYHPDRHQGSPLADLATEKLAEINAAYEVLSDPARRATYDAKLSQSAGGAGWAQTGQQTAHARGPQARMLRALGVAVAIGVVVRLAPLLIRALVALFRLLVEAFGLLEGTPFVAVLFVLAVVGSVALIVRSRKRRG